MLPLERERAMPKVDSLGIREIERNNRRYIFVINEGKTRIDPTINVHVEASCADRSRCRERSFADNAFPNAPAYGCDTVRHSSRFDLHASISKTRFGFVD